MGRQEKNRLVGRERRWSSSGGAGPGDVRVHFGSRGEVSGRQPSGSECQKEAQISGGKGKKRKKKDQFRETSSQTARQRENSISYAPAEGSKGGLGVREKSFATWYSKGEPGGGGRTKNPWDNQKLGREERLVKQKRRRG